MMKEIFWTKADNFTHIRNDGVVIQQCIRKWTVSVGPLHTHHWKASTANILKAALDREITLYWQTYRPGFIVADRYDHWWRLITYRGFDTKLMRHIFMARRLNEDGWVTMRNFYTDEIKPIDKIHQNA